MAGAAIAAGALAGYQVWSGIQQAEMIRLQSGVQTQIADLNAKYADIDAYNARKQGYTEEANYDKQIDQTVGDQREAFASQNVDVNTGTAADLQAETRITGFLNKINIQNQARAKALGFTDQARNYRLGAFMGASNATMQAQGAVAQGIASAAVTGLSGYERGQSGVK